MEKKNKILTLVLVLIVSLAVFLFWFWKKQEKVKKNDVASVVSEQTVDQKNNQNLEKKNQQETSKVVYEKEAANPEVKQSEVIGKFISFDENKQKIIVNVNGEEKTFNCAEGSCSNVEYLKLIDDMTSPAQMTDLKPNSQVNVRFKEDGTILFVLIR